MAKYKKYTISKSKITQYLQKMSLKQILLYSPYARETRIDEINEKEFIRHFFVTTYFTQRLKELEEESRDREVLRDEDTIDLLSEISDEQKELECLSKDKDTFEKSVEFEPINMARYLCGYSGCGKSTYLRNLFYSFRIKKHLTHVFDLALSRSANVNIMGRTYTNQVYKKTLGKFIFVVIQDIAKILVKKQNEEVNDYFETLSNINNFYNKNIRNFIDDFDNYFDSINKFVKSAKSDLDYRCFKEEINKTFSDDIDKITSDISELNLKANIKRFLSLFILLQWGLLDPEVNNDRKCFIAIDSLEHYINRDEVFNNDIKEICSLIDELLNELEDNYNSFYINGEFSKRFTFIISFRDTSIKMLENRNGEDYGKTVIDISHWFDVNQIVNKRLEYFLSKGNQNVDSVIAEAIKVILEDDNFSHGILNKLSGMHNYNKRRFLEYLCDVITEQEATIYRDFYKKSDLSYSEFKNKKAQGVEQKDFQTDLYLSNVYRRASRDMIVRLLFDKINSKNYFVNIFTVINNNSKQSGKSYARRILTYISAKRPIEYQYEYENYIGFFDLLNSVFRPVGGILTKEKTDIVAEVIYNMSNPDKDDTHWCQLVVIKFNEKHYTLGTLKDKIWEIYCNGQETLEENNDFTAYGLKITQAGRFFLKKMADFEYFAVRYLPNEKYLFHPNNLNKSDKDEFHCLKIIKRIKEETFQCIKIMAEFDRNFFSTNGRNYAAMYTDGGGVKKGFLYVNDRGEEQTHIQRIINSHISYLDDYRNYIIDLYKKKDSLLKSFSEEEISELSTNIIKLIKEYVDKLEHFISDEKYVDANENYYIGFKRIGNKDGSKYTAGYRKNIEVAYTKPLEFVWIKKDIKENKKC